ncbi:pentatricopeptide repeat-containing protein At4g39530 [Punica granatum]|uniref:Pentatricopeptide repeat-containing protein At4g39530 n=2 Tax=Punica granatum TaxID=22663 RepID=A0A6P8DXQ8_PUNGR|nr:pentatricopeptide repeat-containing protein At4g39530 [Punica granatum]PKI39038.1 hypothetical protein CRG98_040565 [Punica granatum]
MRNYSPFRPDSRICYGLITESKKFSSSPTQFLPVPDFRPKRQDLTNLLQSTVSGDPISRYKKLHAQIFVWGLQSDVLLGNILLHCYSRSGHLGDARNVLDQMSERNSVTWSSAISMYARHNLNEEALTAFLEFRRSSIRSLNEYVLASAIRACTQLGGLDEGTQLHGAVVKSGFGQDVYVGTALVDLYAKSGDINMARSVFDGLANKTAVTWTSIITGYARIGRSEVSLELFLRLVRDRDANGVPDKYVLSSVLSSCSALEFIEGGKQIHAHVLRRGEEMDVSVVNVLIDFYTKCGRVSTARKLFNEMRDDKNLISWTTMIAGYMQNSYDREAMNLFREMVRLKQRPDVFACTSILTSCGSLKALELGTEVHSYTIKSYLDRNTFVRNGLIDMYAKCGCLVKARRVFDSMADDRNLVSYNAMIEGYAGQEELHEALDIFHEMRVLGFLSPSPLSFVSILRASATLSALELSRQIHGLMIKYGVSLDLFSASSLIDVYSKSCCVRDARLVFDQMTERDIVVWNAMFFGYTNQMENEEALRLYQDLQKSNEKPNGFTFAALITASSNLAILKNGQIFHGQLIKLRLCDDPFVTNALVDMYSKCGSLNEARRAFNCGSRRDTICWNSMIHSYANNGEAWAALEVFESMVKEGVRPNYVTYVGVLSACSHAGLMEDGVRLFNSMSHFRVEPGTEHYACMVSLYGRAGNLLEAKEFIEKMPIEPAPIIWRALLSACRDAGNLEMGKYAAEKAISLDPMDSGSYTLLSNIFASKAMWVDVKKARKRMDNNGVAKEPGQSWIELSNEVSVFLSRDQNHSKADAIYSVLDDLQLQMREIRYTADAGADLVMNG